MEDATIVHRYLCLSVDVVGYGRNDDIEQARIQRELIELLDAAGIAAGLDRRRWLRQAKGDEELCLIPATEVLSRVVGGFCAQLDTLVRAANQARDERAPLRLRLAIDDGPASPAANGFSGRAVVGVSRLINSGPIRRALELADQAALAVMVSHVVFRDWIESGLATVDPRLFRRVRVKEKEVDEDAWLWLPGVNTHRLDLADSAAAKASEPARAAAEDRQQVTANFHAPVRIDNGTNVFGIRNG